MLDLAALEVVLHRTRVKICGITRIEDMHAAVAAGADAIGLVFYAASPRAVTIEQAALIVAATPALVTTVGLFVDATTTEVEQVLRRVPLDMLQFHGDESEASCRQFGRPYMKAIRLRDETDLQRAAQQYASARALLVDTYVKGVPGGTGQVFDWQRLPKHLSKPLVLAGGLTPDNVSAAIIQAAPWAVDVSGGVEAVDEQGKALPGIKSAAAISAFMRGVTRVTTS